MKISILNALKVSVAFFITAIIMGSPQGVYAQCQTQYLPSSGVKFKIKSAWQTSMYLTDNGATVGYANSPTTDNFVWIFEDVGNGQREIKNVATGEYMHIENLQGTVQCTSRNTGAQSSRWTFCDAGSGNIRIRSVWTPDNYIHIENMQGVAQYGAYVQYAMSFLWVLEPLNTVSADRKIVNVKSSRALSVDNASTADGAKVQIWDFNNAPEQIWYLRDLGGGYYNIVGKPSGKVLDVAAGSKNDGAAIQLYQSNGSDAQIWSLNDLGSNQFSIINKGSGKALGVANGGVSNGSQITQWSYTGAQEQQWIITSPNNDENMPQGPVVTHKNLNQPFTEPIIPKWALGYWQSYWGDDAVGYGHKEPFMDHAKSLRGILPNQYGNHQYPADVMVLDMYWCDKNWNWPGNMIWSYTRFPDPQGMIRDLHGMNFKLCMNYHSGGFGYDWLNKMREHLQWGLDVVWLDFWDNGSNYEQQIYDLLGQVDGNKRRMIFARHYARPNKFNYESYPSGTMGSDKIPNEETKQKAMGIHWTGDNDGSWEGMKEAIDGIVYNIDGVMDGWSYLHADCPGHIGGTDPELANRWMQFADWSPISRNHGTSDRDVWSWGAKVEENSKFSRMLRYRLIPYIYTYCNEIYEKAIPLTRPLRLAYPGQRDDIRYSYMFGEEFLVAPVYTKATDFTDKKMGVFLPSGEEWINYWTHELYAGGQTIKVDASEANDKYIPLFVKRGSIIPMGPQIYFINENIHPDPITLDIYPLASGQSDFTLYDDDGVSNDFKSGKSAKTTFTCNKNTDNILITIGASIGTYTGKPATQNYICKINLIDGVHFSIKNNDQILTRIDDFNTLLANDATPGVWAVDGAKKILYIRIQTSVDVQNNISISKTTGLQRIPLSEGWNLVSYNLLPADSSLSALFGSALSNVLEIKNQTSFYSAAYPSQFNSLTTLLPGAAFLVKMSAPDTLVVQGSPMSVDTLVPRKGWNLVGCPFQTKTGFAAGLEQRGFSNFVGLGVIKNFDGYWIPNDAKSSIDSFEPGKGVFLFMKN